LPHLVLHSFPTRRSSDLLVTHSHFDHIVDAPYVTKKTGATFYTEKNFEIIAKAFDKNLKTSPLEVNKPLQIGKFKITAYQRDHRSEEHTSELQSQSNLVC